MGYIEYTTVVQQIVTTMRRETIERISKSIVVVKQSVETFHESVQTTCTTMEASFERHQLEEQQRKAIEEKTLEDRRLEDERRAAEDKILEEEKKAAEARR